MCFIIIIIFFWEKEREKESAIPRDDHGFSPPS